MPNWNKRRGQLQAYLAGIIDGEGSFGVYNLNNSYGGRLTVAMQDPHAVALFKLLYPGGTFTKRNGEYRIVYSNLTALHDLIQDFIPYLLIKHEQAKVTLSYVVHRRRDHQTKANSFRCARCEHFVDTVHALKAKEIKGVNSVNALLTHGLREYRAKREDVEQVVTDLLSLLEGVETRDRLLQAVEPMSAPEQDIVQAAPAV